MTGQGAGMLTPSVGTNGRAAPSKAAPTQAAPAPRVAPDFRDLLSLQALAGNRAVTGLLAGRQAPRLQGQPSVQRVAAAYRTNSEIEALSLTDFDSFARDQADWATGPGVADPDRGKLRALLEFARSSDNLVLGGLGKFKVADLLAKGAGTGGPSDANFMAYSRGCRNGEGPTVAIKDQAATLDAASDWGAALLKLEVTPGRQTINMVLKQESGGAKHNLQDLVDNKFVDDFIRYITTVGPNLEADNGADLNSYVLLRKDPADPVTYKGKIPDVLDYHRFEKAALEALVVNLAKPKSAKPLSLILHSGLDHNGAFHRDPNLTALIRRTTHVTIMVEGKATLADLGALVGPLGSRYKTDGKVDEVMMAGHGNAQVMELAGTTKDGKVDTEHDVETNDADTTALYGQILAAMENSPNARIVFNACLTNSNKVNIATLDADPKKAAAQITGAIAVDPSLATELRAKAKALGKSETVLGSNASFGEIGLQDPSGKMDLRSTEDPQLTTPDKLKYAELGTEPQGAVRAVLEAWALDQAAGKTDTIDAMKRRIAAKSGSTDWDESVIQAIYALIVAAPTDAQRINSLEPAAGSLSEAKLREEARVSKIMPDVPAPYRDSIFTRLMATTNFKNDDFISVVLFEIWMATDDGRKNSFIGALAQPSLNTSTAADIVDLGYIEPMLGPKLLPPPPAGTFIRGEILLACMFLAQQGAGAPAQVKTYVSTLVGAGQQHFPPGANLPSVLVGTTEDDMLTAAGIKPKASAAGVGAGPSAPTPNIDIGHTGTNNFYVEPLTQRAQPVKPSIDVLDKPGGAKKATLAAGATMNVIGQVETFFAIDFSGDTAFVSKSDAKVL